MSAVELATISCGEYERQMRPGKSLELLGIAFGFGAAVGRDYLARIAASRDRRAARDANAENENDEKDGCGPGCSAGQKIEEHAIEGHAEEYGTS